MLNFLQKLSTFAKKYWAIAVLIIGSVVAALLFRKQNTTITDELEKIKAAHELELEKIKLAREEQQRQHEANAERLQSALTVVQQQYESAKKEFDAKKKSEVEKIIKEHGNNPDELAKRLSVATGFKIVMPN